MASALDMSGTLAFYRAFAPILMPRIIAALGQKYIPEDVLTVPISDAGNHLVLSPYEIRSAIAQFPLDARLRARTSGIYGKQDLWFAKQQGAEIKVTAIELEAMSPTALVPSYVDNRGGKEDPKIHLFGLAQSMRNGTLDEAVARIIQAEGLLHEYGHVLNWGIRRSAYANQPKAPLLSMGGKTIDGCDALVAFAELMEKSTPLSHYSSHYWSVDQGVLVARNGDVSLAVDEELAESIAAFFLGFTFSREPDRRLQPFIDRDAIYRFVIDYLQARVIEPRQDTPHF